MHVVRTVTQLREALTRAVRDGASIGLVPTMGALHAGHTSLVEASFARDTITVVSVFVNPLQFGAGEDLGAYPRDLDGDLAVLAAAGTGDEDVLFAPLPETFTPEDARTVVRVEGPLATTLEGASRPHHIEGVATIVTKLLSAARPDRAYFGEKDFQQVAVVRALARDLDLGVEIVGCPLVRDDDGVALSSRNAYLTRSERSDARALHAALQSAAEGWGGDASRARRLLRDILTQARGVGLDYAEVVDPETLEPLEGPVEGPARALVAAWVGPTRLIDNLRLEP